MGLQSLRIGGGSAYGNDRLEPPRELIDHGGISYLAMDSLAERTLALAQERKRVDPNAGFDERLDDIVRILLPRAIASGVKIIGNMGGANPEGAVERIEQLSREMGLEPYRIACVTGDDLLDDVESLPLERFQDEPMPDLDRVVSANAYLGAGPIVEALAEGADIVVTGRVADPSLFLGPMMHELGWEPDAWDVVAGGQTLAHLVECAGYVTGSHFADPPFRNVPGLEDVGFPIAEVRADGTGNVTKLPGSGGIVTEQTCKAQLVYEIHDPEQYITPDVVVNVKDVKFRQVDTDVVSVSGARGGAAPTQAKVLVGVDEGYKWEGEILYSGATALNCARLAEETVRKRIELAGLQQDIARMRFDYIGLNAANQDASPLKQADPYEVRLRFAGVSHHNDVAKRMAQEVEWLYMGPNGGGGVRKSVTRMIGMYSALVDWDFVRPNVSVEEVSGG